MESQTIDANTRKRRLAAGAALVLLLAAAPFAWDRWMVEKRLAPEPFAIGELRRFNRRNVRPHLLHLIDELEAGRVLGAEADQFRVEIEKADEIRGGRKRSFTTYVFYENPAGKDIEGEPFLCVVVQNKFGHIFRCVAGTPCF